jgi:hypothetical protein
MPYQEVIAPSPSARHTKMEKSDESVMAGIDTSLLKAMSTAHAT